MVSKSHRQQSTDELAVKQDAQAALELNKDLITHHPADKIHYQAPLSRQTWLLNQLLDFMEKEISSPSSKPSPK